MFAVAPAEALSSGTRHRQSYWHDREIHFDTAPSSLRVAAAMGEVVCGTFDSVEDTKGNNGQAGTLVLTNLRVLWWSSKRHTLNLSIGWSCVQHVSVQTTASKLLGGTAEALFLTTKYNGSRFQFVFTLVHASVLPTLSSTMTSSGTGVVTTRTTTTTGNDNNSSGGGGNGSATTTPMTLSSSTSMSITTTTATAMRNNNNKSSSSDAAAATPGVQQRRRLVDTAQRVWRAYDRSRLYRELRMRAALLEHGNLLLLPHEQVLSRLAGVSHVSKEQGHMGTLLITNVRLVWYATASDDFNASLPYMQLVSVSCKQSKYGRALVIVVSQYAGGYVFGFRVDPVARLRAVHREVVSFWTAWRERPLLGVHLDNNDDDNGSSSGSGGSTSTTAVTTHRDTVATGTARGDDVRATDAPDNDNNHYNSNREVDDERVVQQAPSDAFAAYYMDVGQKAVDRRPVYDVSLGLAVEKPRHGVTLQQLWAVPMLS